MSRQQTAQDETVPIEVLTKSLTFRKPSSLVMFIDTGESETFDIFAT